MCPLLFRVGLERMSVTPSGRTTSSMADDELRREIENMEKTNSELEQVVAQQHLTLQQLCAKATRLQQTAEVEEDHIANTLLRRLEEEKCEKKRCTRMLKAEQVAKRQVLRQIAEVRTQQAEIENQVEQEQEFIVNQLQKDLLFVASVKNEAERALVKERLEYLHMLHSQVSSLRAMQNLQQDSVRLAEDEAFSPSTPEASLPPAASPLSTSPSTPPLGSGRKQRSAEGNDTLVYDLEKELNELLARQVEAQAATLQQEKACTALAAKLAEIQREALVDRSRAAKLREELEKARQDLAELQRSRSTPASQDDSGATPPHGLRGTLRSRTLELLSTPTLHPTGIVPVVRRRATSESSVRSTSPSAPLSGYTTDVDAAQYAHHIHLSNSGGAGGGAGGFYNNNSSLGLDGSLSASQQQQPYPPSGRSASSSQVLMTPTVQPPTGSSAAASTS